MGYEVSEETTGGVLLKKGTRNPRAPYQFFPCNFYKRWN